MPKRAMAVFDQCRLFPEHGAQLCRGFEQFGGLVADYFAVAVFAGIRIVAVEQLQDFAFGNDVGGVRKDFHDPHAAHADHHFKGARVEEITDQNGGFVAPDGIGRLVAAAQVRSVDHVIVQQGRGMNEFDDRRQFDMVPDPGIRRHAPPAVPAGGAGVCRHY